MVANLSYEKLFKFSLADNTAAFLLEGVLLLRDAFDQDVFFHTSLDVVLDFLAAFGGLIRSGKGVQTGIFVVFCNHRHVLYFKTIKVRNLTLSEGYNLPTTFQASLHF